MRIATSCCALNSFIQALGLKVEVNNKPHQACSQPWMKHHRDGKKKRAEELRRREFFQDVFAATFAIVCSRGYFNPQLANAITISKSNGAILPPEGEIEKAIPVSWEGVENPFDVTTSNSASSDLAGMFRRLDNTPDSVFYAQPRIVEHVDDNAVRRMTAYISEHLLQPNGTVLDLCSSWTSHFSVDVKQKLHLQQVVGLGMNDYELSKNSVLDRYIVQDLNVQPQLPFTDSLFDLVLCQLSIDYLTKPLEVMKEVGRVLKAGGVVAIFFSNRLFLEKVRHE